MLKQKKIIEIEATEPFANDVLNRRPYVLQLATIIGQIEPPFVIVIDAPWGTGKTTTVRLLEAHLRNQNYATAYLNAWEIDYVSDPLVPLINLIVELLPKKSKLISKIKKISSRLNFRVETTLKQVVKVATHNMVDLEKKAPIEPIADYFSEFQKQQQSLIDLKLLLNEAIEEIREKTGKKENLVILIDELDRCKPIFSIHLLERIKHVMNIDKIIFVLAIDKQQLSESVKHVYGAGFDPNEYLRRFFDFQVKLPQVDRVDFIQANMEDQTVAKQLAMIANELKLTLRMIEQIISRFNLVWSFIDGLFDENIEINTDFNQSHRRISFFDEYKKHLQYYLLVMISYFLTDQFKFYKLVANDLADDPISQPQNFVVIELADLCDVINNEEIASTKFRDFYNDKLILKSGILKTQMSELNLLKTQMRDLNYSKTPKINKFCSLLTLRYYDIIELDYFKQLQNKNFKLVDFMTYCLELNAAYLKHRDSLGINIYTNDQDSNLTSQAYNTRTIDCLAEIIQYGL